MDFLEICFIYLSLKVFREKFENFIETDVIFSILLVFKRHTERVKTPNL